MARDADPNKRLQSCRIAPVKAVTVAIADRIRWPF
jgi:hypothetical protein